MLPRRMFLDNMLEDLEKEENMKCDIYEKKGIIHIEMDVPGFDKKDIKVEMHKGTLTITAEKTEEEHEDEHKKYLRRERKYYGKYQRSFYLGEVKENEIEAHFNNGILKVTVPKEDANSNKKQIEVK